MLKQKQEMEIRLDEFCVQLMIIASTLMLVLSSFFEVETLRYCIYAIVALTFVLIPQMKFKLKQLIPLACFLVSSFAALFLYGGNMGSLIVSIASLFLAMFLFEKSINLPTWRLVKICTYIVSLSFIAQFIFAPQKTIYNQLLLCFDNPNMTGIALLAPAMILVVMLFEKQKVSVKIIDTVILAVLAYMIYQTQNRGSLLSLIVAIVAAFLASLKKKPKRLTSPVAFALLKLTPIFVMLIYILLFLILPEDLELLGKPFFSGRELAWINAIKSIVTNPFVHHSFKDGTLNLFWEGAARYGVLAMIGYFWILINYGKTKEELKRMDKINYIAFVAFHCCLLQQSFESTLLTGSYTVHIWSYLLLGIASMKSTKPNEKENTAA